MIVACFSLLACTLLGCLSAPPAPAKDWPAATPADVVVVLQPGDLLKIKFMGWPELDEEQAIRPDGKIALLLVGDVEAAGQTPEQLRAKLLGLYTSKIKNPEEGSINVVVSGFDSQRVYVGGEVKLPGLVMLKGKLTPLEAIMQCGGFLKESAKLSTVVVIRQRDGKQYAVALDLKKSLEQPESTPFYLQAHDVVYVSRTAIDRVDQWVNQYVNQIIPKNLHYTFSETVGTNSSRTITQVQ